MIALEPKARLVAARPVDRPVVVAVAEVEPDGAVIPEDASHLTEHADQGLHELVRCWLKADLLVDAPSAAIAALVTVLRTLLFANSFFCVAFALCVPGRGESGCLITATQGAEMVTSRVAAFPLARPIIPQTEVRR